tara:strand:+ start:1724 stop:3001 length:1278 start_codon:yes stop_codon:yes gene_type:complete
MANNFDSNITRKLARIFLDKFETSRVITKSVDTQLLSGQFNPSTGDTVDFKRPTDYVSVRTANGDVSSETASPIVTGKASGVVQDYFTAFVNYDEADEAIKMDQIDQLLAPLATRIVTDMELDFASFMMKNSGLLAGTYGTAADTWDDIAEAGAVLQSHGVPYDDKWCYAVNPYTQRKLASSNRSLGAGGVAGSIIKSSLERATIADDFAGMNVMTSTALASYTTSTVTDRAGTLSGTPTATYLAHKDTMKQTLAVTAMGADAVVKAGEVIQVTGRNRLNLSTRQEILDETGANILWTAVVTADVTLNGSGAGNLVCTGPAIYEAAGAYNSVSSALTSGDVVTRLGAHSTTYQPNLFWHKQAFSLGSVPIKKLYSTDTLATTEDGMQIRVSKYSDGDANAQKVRFDLRPAYGVMNPFFAGQGFGS